MAKNIQKATINEEVEKMKAKLEKANENLTEANKVIQEMYKFFDMVQNG